MSSPTGPITVVAIYYADREKATRGLRALLDLQGRSDIGVLDAALMSQSERGHKLKFVEGIRVDQYGESSAVLDLIFPAGVLAINAVGPKAEAAAGHFAEQGFATNLLKEIGENVPPEGAALVAVIEEKWFADLTGAIADSVDLGRFATQVDTKVEMLTRPTEG